MSDLEGRFDKLMNDRSRPIIDDLFDGLKVLLFLIEKQVFLFMISMSFPTGLYGSILE